MCRIGLLFLFCGFSSLLLLSLIWFIIISLFSSATICFIYFRSFRETLPDLSLSRHSCRFKFYVTSAIACVKIFSYFVKRFFQLILLLLFHRFPLREFLEFFIYRVITDVSYSSVFYLFLPALVCYAFQSIATFTRVLSFTLVFTVHTMWPSSLEIEIYNK